MSQEQKKERTDISELIGGALLSVLLAGVGILMAVVMLFGAIRAVQLGCALISAPAEQGYQPVLPSLPSRTGK
mgnify:CR=1 FL=1